MSRVASDEKWNEQYQNVIGSIMANYGIKEDWVVNWVKNVRTAYKEGKLSQSRIKAIQETIPMLLTSKKLAQDLPVWLINDKCCKRGIDEDSRLITFIDELGIKSLVELAKNDILSLGTYINVLNEFREYIGHIEIAYTNKQKYEWITSKYQINEVIGFYRTDFIASNETSYWNNRLLNAIIKSRSNKFSINDAMLLRTIFIWSISQFVDFYINPDRDINAIKNNLDAAIDFKLSPREKMVITERFYNRKTLEEIGKSYNVNRERIRQIEAKALRKLSHSSNKLNLTLTEEQRIERERLRQEKLKREQEQNSNPSGINKKLDTLELSVRSYNILYKNIKSDNLADVLGYMLHTKKTIPTILEGFRNCGKRSSREIIDKLRETMWLYPDIRLDSIGLEHKEVLVLNTFGMSTVEDVKMYDHKLYRRLSQQEEKSLKSALSKALHIISMYPVKLKEGQTNE